MCGYENHVRALSTMIVAVKVSFPAFLSEWLGCAMFQSLHDVVEDKVTSLCPFPSPMIAVASMILVVGNVHRWCSGFSAGQQEQSHEPDSAPG